ncbi:peptidoglycan DD-metalloendopeptidase family protein [Saccharomonospora sp. NPDC006951]
MAARHPLRKAVPASLFAAMVCAATLAPASASAQSDPDSLSDRIAAAEAELDEAQAALATTYDTFTSAQHRFDAATRKAQEAQRKADEATVAAREAAKQATEAQGNVDELASASFRQGSVVGSSLTTYLGSRTPAEMMERSSLLNALGGEHLDSLGTLQRAVDEQRSFEATAKTSLREARDNEAEAAVAKTEAEKAYSVATGQQEEAKANTDRLLAQKASLESQLAGTGAAAAAAEGAPAPSASGVVKPTTGTLTSTYGPRGGTIHYGIDIANSIGTPIVSVLDGEVISAGPASGFGLWVRVQHANGLITVYGHIDQALVSVGQRVTAGQQIATLGNRGESTGPHLHFEVHDNGQKIDPLVWLRSNGVDI